VTAFDTLSLIGSRAAADRLGVEVSTVTRYVTDGILVPATKLDGRNGAYVFHRADVEELASALAASADVAELVPAGKARELLGVTPRRFTALLAAGDLTPAGRLTNGRLLFRLADITAMEVE